MKYLGVDRGDFMEISSEKLSALDEIGPVQLLVRRAEEVGYKKGLIRLKVQAY